ncbi:MAG: hypothetical protein ABI321_21725 [Polyangia bacterium]
MSSLARSLLVLSTSLAFACGGGGLGNTTDAGGTQDLATSGKDAAVTIDAAVSTDSAVSSSDFATAGDFSGIACGTMTCATGSVCCIKQSGSTVQQMCVTGTSCADGGITAACDGPEDCSSASPSCCADIVFDQGQMSTNGAAMCTASCPGSASVGNNSGEIKTKLCHNAGECVGYTGNTQFGMLPYDHCCGYTGATYRFCAPKAAEQITSGIDCGSP